MEKFTFKTRVWIQVALINFCVVALAGVTLRYKINFPLPAIDQKYLLHAHSNFAFTGWVTVAFMALMVNYLQQHNVITNYKKYNLILIANCICAYGMFISFILDGYAFYSIAFSSLSILISYFFIFYLWRDLNKVNDKSYAPKWLKAALTLWAISSLGAFALAYLMANNIAIQFYYFGAVYFFLHFQYNGWFLFACFGLLFSHLYKSGFLPSVSISKKLFMIMAVTVAPTYFLSVLWMNLPPVLHLIADISGILQLLVLFYFIKLFPVIKKSIPRRFTKTTRVLWLMASFSFILKIILQMLSTIHFLSHYAFGFRPIVIGYLHLSFLGIVTFFILGYINELLSETLRQISQIGLSFFVIGVLVQEIILMAQGLEVIEFEPVPYANIILFACAVIMATGMILIATRVNKVKQIPL